MNEELPQINAKSLYVIIIANHPLPHLIILRPVCA